MTMKGKVLKDLELPSGMLIAAVYRSGEVIIPDGNTKLLSNDRVIVISLLTDVPELEKLLKKR